MGKAKLTAALIVLILLVIVFMQNSQPVQFKFLFFEPVSVPKTVLILSSAVFGAAVTLLAQIAWRRRKRKTTVPATRPAEPPVPPAAAPE